MRNTFISVIITCYNLEKYIAEAIESVINQDCDSSLYEIIVVDDCSTDRSAEIVESFKSVRYVKTLKNQGVLLATVLGMQHANGDVIAFLDGDDVWRSDKLSRVSARFYDDNSLIFLTHNYRFMDEAGNDASGLEYTQKVYSQLTDQDQISELIIDGILQRKNYVWLGSAYSFRLKSEDINAFIDWTRTLPNPQFTYQDWPLAFWIAASCPGRFGYDQEKLLSYRIHSANFSGDSKSLEKAIRNWSKAYYTSAGMLDIAERFPCNEIVRSVCRSAVIRDEMILRLFQHPSQFSVLDFLKNWGSFGSSRDRVKELVRVLLIKVFGLGPYFFLKNMICH